MYKNIIFIHFIMQIEDVKDDIPLLESINVVVDISNVMVDVEVITFAGLLCDMLKSDTKTNEILILGDEALVIILKLLENSPDYFNDIELALAKIIKDNKIDTSDIPSIIVLIQKLYELIYKLKGFKIDSKKRCEICASILKFLFRTLVEYEKIELSEEEKDDFLSKIDILIDSFIGLVRFPKELKTRGCIHSIFGKK